MLGARSGVLGPWLNVRALSASLSFSPFWRSEGQRGCTHRAGVGVLASMRRAQRNGSAEGSLGEPTSNFGWNLWDVLRGYWASKQHARLQQPPLPCPSDFRAPILDLEPLPSGQRPLPIRMAPHPGCLPEGAPGFEIFHTSVPWLYTLYPMPRAWGTLAPTQP